MKFHDRRKTKINNQKKEQKNAKREAKISKKQLKGDETGKIKKLAKNKERYTNLHFVMK